MSRRDEEKDESKPHIWIILQNYIEVAIPLNKYLN